MRHVRRSFVLLAVLTAALLGTLLPTLAQDTPVTCDPAVNYGELAATQYANSDYQAAINSLSCLIQRNPENASAFNMRGNAYRRLGSLPQAVEDYAHAIGLEPDYAIAYNNLGWTYYLRNQYTNALVNLDRAIELDSSLAFAYNNRGLVHQAMGDYDLAIDDYNTAIQLGHEPLAWPQYNLQQAALLRDSAVAAPPPTATPSETQVLLDLIAEADDYYSAHDYAQAITAYEQVVALSPENAEAYFRMGFAHGELDQYEQAIENNTLAIEYGYSPLQWPYNNRGWDYAQLNQYEVAIEDYTRALELDPQYGRAYFNRSFARGRLGEYEAAIADAELALENGYSTPKYAYNNLGHYWEQLGDLDKALDNYNRSLEVDPNYTLALRNRADIERDMGLNDEALADYNRAIELEPNNDSGYLSRGIFYLMRGDDALAGPDLMTYFNLIETQRFDESPLAIGDTLSLDMAEGWVHYVPFSGETGQVITVTADSETVDSLLVLLDPDGEALTAHDDLSRADFNLNAALINYRLPMTGDYTLVVGHAGSGSDGVIELALSGALDAEELTSRAYDALLTGDYDTAVTMYSQLIELDPENAVAYYNRGDAFANLDQYDLAIEDFAAAVDIDPNYVDAIHYRGVMYELQGDYETALADYNQALEIDPTYKLSHFGRGNMLQKLGDHEAAIAAYDNVLRLDPDYAGAYHNRGISHEELGQYEAAVADYTQAMDLSPEYDFLVYDRASAYLDMGDYESALADYNTALERDPEDAGAYLGRGIANSGLDDRAAAAADFMQWWDLNDAKDEIDSGPIERDQDVTVQMAEGRVYRLPFTGEKGQRVTFQAISTNADPLLVILSPEGDPLTADDDGGGDLNARIDDFVLPANGDYTLLVGHAGGGSEGTIEVIFGDRQSLKALLAQAQAASDRQDYETAVADYTQALELDPENADVYFDRGYNYGEQGEYEKAVADYDQAIEYGFNPLAWVYHNRGWAYRKLGEYDKAIPDFDQAIKLDPMYALAYHNRGYTYADMGEHDKAVADFDRVVELEPTNANALFDRAFSYGELDNYEQSAADYGRALENGYEPAARAYHNQGWAYREMEEYDKALEAYNAAIALDPNYTQAYYGRGYTYALMDDYEAAVADYTLALDNGYDEPWDIYYDRGDAYLEMEEWALAKADFSEVIRENADDEDAYLSRGIAYIGLDSRADAAADFMQWFALIETERIEQDEALPVGIPVTLPIEEGQVYSYPFEGIAGDMLTVTADSKDADPLLVVLDSEGEPLTADDDDGGDLNAFIDNFELPEDGSYTLIVGHAGGGSEGDIELTFGEKLTVEDILNRAQRYFYDGDYDLALDDYGLAIELDPGNPQLYYDRAYVHTAQEDYKAAIADYTLALEYGFEPAVWVYYSRALNYNLAEDYELAVEEYTRAVETDPEFASAYYGRATTYNSLEEWEKAAEDYSSALEYNYNNPLAVHYGRANAYISLEEWTLAKADYNYVIREDSTIPGPYLGRGIGYIGLNDRVTAGEDFMQWFALTGDSHQISSSAIELGKPRVVYMTDGRQYLMPFEGEAGQVITVTANSDDADPLLVILDADGVPITADDDGGEHYNSLISDFELPADGDYTLVVGHAGGGSFGMVNVSLTVAE